MNGRSLGRRWTRDPLGANTHGGAGIADMPEEKTRLPKRNPARLPCRATGPVSHARIRFSLAVFEAWLRALQQTSGRLTRLGAISILPLARGKFQRWCG